MSKTKVRPFPDDGTIVCIPLRKGGYAYGLRVRSLNLWLYNILTVKPIFDPGLFKRERWLQYTSCHDGGLGSETFDVGVIDLTPDDIQAPRTFSRIPEQALRRNPPPPTAYIGHDPYAPHVSVSDYYITEAELPEYQEYMMLTHKQLLDWLEKNRHRLEKIEVDPAKVVTTGMMPEAEAYEPPTIFEIWLSELEKMKITDLDGIAEALDADLEKHHAGEVIGSGQVGGQDQHNIAVQIAPGKKEAALACIRRVLKNLGADPDTTDIWEQGDDDEDAGGTITHSLIP